MSESKNGNTQPSIDLNELDKEIREKISQFKEVKFMALHFVDYLNQKFQPEGQEGYHPSSNNEEYIEEEEEKEECVSGEEKSEDHEFDDYGLPEEEFIKVITEHCKKYKTPSYEEIQNALKKRAEEIFLG